MSHYSEMDFLFTNKPNNSNIVTQLNASSEDNQYNILKDKKYVRINSAYTIYKTKDKMGTTNIKNYIKNNIYDKETSLNPYMKLLQDFNKTYPTSGAGLRLKAGDLVYLRELGVYPINRMAILRRFPEGCFVPEDLNEMCIEPISTIIGWLKPEDNFGEIGFKENWTTTNERFDTLLVSIIKKAIGLESPIGPLPDFAQGMLFEFYSKMGLENASSNNSVDENYEVFNANALGAIQKRTNNNTAAAASTSASATSTATGSANSNPYAWGLNKIPIGDPNVLREGPYRDPETQNITSDFTFNLETTYEQKLLGDVDPGSAMLDILDNIYAMGTSNMAFFWGDAAPAVTKAMGAISNSANNLNSWWEFVANILSDFWDTINSFFTTLKNKVSSTVNQASTGNISSAVPSLSTVYTTITALVQTILASTISIHRFKLRGSLELMIGGKYSSTPWYLTIGNPYTPWLATNHIVVKAATVTASTEMGFNDQPQRLTAKFTCNFSRSLGKQELMRMFNNSFRRNYSAQPLLTTRQATVSTSVAGPVASSSTNPQPLMVPINNNKSAGLGASGT